MPNPAFSLLAALAWAAALPAQAVVTNHVYAWDRDADVIFDQSSTAAALQGGTPAAPFADNGPWLSGQSLFAQAAGQTLTWRAGVATASHDATQAVAQADSALSVTINPGRSGLAIGTPVLLTLSVHADGRVSSGVQGAYEPRSGQIVPNDFNLLAGASGAFGIDIRDPMSPYYDSETGTPMLSFSASAHTSVQATQCQDSPSCPGGSSFYSWGRHVQVQAQWQPGLQFPSGQQWQWSGNLNEFGEGHNIPLAPRVDASFDTGLLQLDFISYVGNTLQISGSAGAGFDCFVGGWNCAGYADFAHTMDAELFSSVAGLELTGVVAGVTPVPEPATLALWLAGAGLLAARRLRGRA